MPSVINIWTICPRCTPTARATPISTRRSAASMTKISTISSSAARIEKMPKIEKIDENTPPPMFAAATMVVLLSGSICSNWLRLLTALPNACATLAGSGRFSSHSCTLCRASTSRSASSSPACTAAIMAFTSCCDIWSMGKLCSSVSMIPATIGGTSSSAPTSIFDVGGSEAASRSTMARTSERRRMSATVPTATESSASTRSRLLTASVCCIPVISSPWLETSTALTLPFINSSCCASLNRSITTGMQRAERPRLVDDGTHAEAHGQRPDIDLNHVAHVGAQPLRAQPVEIQIALPQLQAVLRPAPCPGHSRSC